ncbi:MAG TPA: TonB-dependent receptor [Rubrivivax sp.]|nr:TonB-dependent receptor [Rubrivivax sp.]
MYQKTRISKALLLAFGGSMVMGAAPPAAQAQRVEITGSSIKRVETEGALPVQTLTRTDIERTGVQTTEQLMQTISAMSSSGQTMGSTGVTNATYGLSTVSLRGLGEERTLVLLNGRRMAPFSNGSGAVNVNNIPLAAIERVEILKDGASAIYGSDAEAGVVNFIMTKNFQGYQLGATAGSPTTNGGGQQYLLNFIGGWGDQSKDDWNLTVTGQWQRNQALFSKSRSYAKTDNNFPWTLPTATGQGNIQGAWTPGVGPNHLPNTPYLLGGVGSSYGNPLAASGQCASVKNIDDVFADPATPSCAYDSGAYLSLFGQTEDVSLTGNFSFRLNDKAEIFADALWSRSKATTQIQPSPLRTSFMETDDLFGVPGQPGSTDRVLLLRTTNPNYGIAANYLNSVGLGQLVGSDLGITARVFDFGNRITEDTSTQSRVVVGVRGELMEQFYNVALVTGQNRLDGQVTSGYFSQLGYAQATQAPNSDWNPWSLNQSPAFQNLIRTAEYAGPTLSSKSTTSSLDATLSGDVWKLPAGMMQYAAGYQFRKDKLELSPSAALLSGDIAGLGGATRGFDADRHVNAVFGELNIPVVKAVDLNLATRYDGYSDVGSTTNWKGNLRWQPTQQLMIRGAYGTGFRAPTLNNLFEPNVLQTSVTIQDGGNCNPNDPTDCFVGQVNELTGGNPKLKPETSRQYGVGLVFQPLPSLAVGLDWFNIKVDDTISQPSTQEVIDQNLAGNPLYAGKVVRDASGAIVQVINPPDNNGTLEAQGMDLELRYREKLGPGLLMLGLNGTYYFKYDQSTPGAGTSHKVATMTDPTGTTPVISSSVGLDGMGVVLRYKQYLSATWVQGDWATTIGNQFATGYYAGADWNDEQVRMPSQTLWDLQVAYSGIKHLVLTLGARNLFDKQPASFSNAYLSQFQSGYDSSQYDPRGRFVYLSGTLTF